MIARISAVSSGVKSTKRHACFFGAVTATLQARSQPPMHFMPRTFISFCSAAGSDLTKVLTLFCMASPVLAAGVSVRFWSVSQVVQTYTVVGIYNLYFKLLYIFIWLTLSE